MGQISVTITDFADTRAFQCKLSADAPVGSIAARLAEMVRYPNIGPDGAVLNYGLIAKNGTLLDSNVSLEDHDLPESPVLRLVPEITIGSALRHLVGKPDDTVMGAVGADYHTGVLPFPPRDLYLGPRPNIQIDAGVRREIESFAKRDPELECAGLLLGTVVAEDEHSVVHITAIAPAAEAVGSRATVKITLEAWESMLAVRDASYPELQVLGWFHSHAGWGVFMSEADVFIQRNFFSHPAMVAYVLDSINGRDGFYYWHEGEITLCPSYGVVGANAGAVESRSHKKQSRPDPRDYLIVALIGAVVYLGLIKTTPVDHNRMASKPPAAVVHVVKKAPAPEKIETSKLTSQAASSKSNKADRSARSKTTVYTIVEGDTLGKICYRVYGDSSLGPALLEYNKINDDTGLQIGQEILLPSKGVLQPKDKPQVESNR